MILYFLMQSFTVAMTVIALRGYKSNWKPVLLFFSWFPITSQIVAVIFTIRALETPKVGVEEEDAKWDCTLLGHEWKRMRESGGGITNVRHIRGGHQHKCLHCGVEEFFTEDDIEAENEGAELDEVHF